MGKAESASKKVELAHTSEDAVTQTFTGKELDRYDDDMSIGADGEGWYYFGARYYDPDVGLWVSCDNAKEYYSSYTFVGNNPIALLDPDGNVTISATLTSTAGCIAGGGGSVTTHSLNVNAALSSYSKRGKSLLHKMSGGVANVLDGIEKYIFFDKTPNSLDAVYSGGGIDGILKVGTFMGWLTDVSLGFHIGEQGDFAVQAFGEVAAGLGVVGKLGLTTDLPSDGNTDYGGWGISVGGGVAVGGDIGGGLQFNMPLKENIEFNK